MLLHCRVLCRAAVTTTATSAAAAAQQQQPQRRRCGGVCFAHRGVCALPHPAKAHRGGEDAYFAHAYGVGVADGVGGYAAHGVDPAQYTRHLMRFALQSMDAATMSQEQQQQTSTTTCDGKSSSSSSDDDKDTDTLPVRGVDALQLLRDSVHKVKALRQPGGCPVVVVTLVDGDVASVLNLGDCGVLLLREGKLLYRSAVQQHRFNCPYQLPDDAPEVGERARVTVRDGDVCLCASDGVYDNVDTDELLTQLAEVDSVGCTRVAQAIGSLAARYARSATRMTPFARHAHEAGYAHRGGKLDDITALVARVTTTTAASAGDSEHARAAPCDVCPSLITELLHLPD